jgi:ABC-type branched-subunit amino acid transport system ATPase component
VSAILKVEELRGGYGTTEVVHGLSFEIRSGQIYSLIGKNGMGKSTLLKLILGLLPPRGGRIYVGGVDVTGDKPNAIVDRSVAYVPQDQALFQDLSVEENLRLGALGMTRAAFQERKQAVSAFFPFLRDRLRQRAGTLSGGEQKMLLLARALIPQPKLVLIDEVTEGVQPMVVAKMRDVLSEATRSTGMSLLLVEQNIQFALGLADRFGVINQGNLVDEGEPAAAGARERAEAHLTI